MMLRYRPRAAHNLALPRHWTQRRIDELRAVLLLRLLAQETR